SNSGSDAIDIHELRSTTPCSTDAATPRWTDLKSAITMGDLSSALFHLKADLISDNDKNDILLLAAERGWCVAVKALIELGAFLEHKDDKAKRTAISFAASSGDFNTVSYLLEKGSFPNFRDRDDRTPLSYASMEGHNAIVK